MIQLHKQSVRLGSDVLFQVPKFSLKSHDRVALLAPNGAGKSVFMRQLVAQVFPHAMRIAYCPQQLPEEMRNVTLEGWLGQAGDQVDVHEFLRLCQLRALPMQVPIRQLSGGQERMAALLFTLCHMAEIYFFDEPTNHLDISGIIWFERYLLGRQHGYFIISHDVAFLERTVQGYWAIHEQVLRYYHGNYESYLSKREAEEIAAQSERRRHEVALAQEERYRARGVTARRKRNQKRLERLEELRSLLSHRPQAAEARFADMAGQALPDQVMIELCDFVPHVYLKGQALALPSVRRQLTRKSCVALVGANAIGKTCLLRALLNPQTQGVRHRASLSVAFLDQMRALPEDEVVLDLVARGSSEVRYVTADGVESMHPLSYLKRFGLDREKAFCRYGLLSGGEKMKACLARALTQPIDVLVLDEPSNDLDIESIEELAEFLEGFHSLVFLVTHDRYLLNQCATETWYLSERGCIMHPGGFEDRFWEALPAVAAPVATKAQRQNIRLIMKEIESQEAQLHQIDALLADPARYSGANYDVSSIQSLQAQRLRCQERIARLYDEWAQCE